MLRLEGADTAAAPERGRRSVMIGGREQQVDVLRGEPQPGTEIRGPAVVELPESTLLVPEAWSGAVNPAGTIVLERAR